MRGDYSWMTPRIKDIIRERRLQLWSWELDWMTPRIKDIIRERRLQLWSWELDWMTPMIKDIIRERRLQLNDIQDKRHYQREAITALIMGNWLNDTQDKRYQWEASSGQDTSMYHNTCTVILFFLILTGDHGNEKTARWLGFQYCKNLDQFYSI